jgi:hypothetical protein
VTPPRYRPTCPTCPWTGREYTRSAYAEQAAADHCKDKGHVTHVIDHYGLRVVGTTAYPDTERNARP